MGAVADRVHWVREERGRGRSPILYSRLDRERDVLSVCALLRRSRPKSSQAPADRPTTRREHRRIGAIPASSGTTSDPSRRAHQLSLRFGPVDRVALLDLPEGRHPRSSSQRTAIGPSHQQHTLQRVSSACTSLQEPVSSSDLIPQLRTVFAHSFQACRPVLATLLSLLAKRTSNITRCCPQSSSSSLSLAFVLLTPLKAIGYLLTWKLV